ncbi:MAG TPA: hypothetical protein VF044_01640, partial [Actinomycetota bacterium]
MTETPSGWSAQVIPVDQGGVLRAFVSLDDLERIVDIGTPWPEVLASLRKVYRHFEDRGIPAAVV